MDPEYAVIGRVARRIWARAMRDLYGAGPRSQMLKYHIQTSGRSLHAQEIQFNDIRTTLQALYALFDNCNSLHTNAYDEAITTPTEESVRRAVAIQLIINRELGLNKTQNPWQGSFAIEELTDLVEEAVYREFDRISERGGVLGAMETMYQRGKIQEESLYYETLKHDGTLPIIGVNTFLAQQDAGAEIRERGADPLDRRGEGGPDDRRARVPGAQCGSGGRPRSRACRRWRRRGGNVFAELMETVKVASLGRSRARSTRSAGSTGATCRAGSGRLDLAEPLQHALPRLVAQPFNRVAAGGDGQRFEDLDLDAARAREDGAVRQRPACAVDHGRHHGCIAACGSDEGADVESLQAQTRVERALGKEHQRMACLRTLHDAPRGAMPAPGGLAIDELGADPPQQETDHREARGLALDHEAEAWRERRLHDDAIQVARVIRHQDAGVGGQEFEPGHADRQRRGAQPEPGQPAGRRTAPVEPRYDQCEQGCRHHEGCQQRERPDSGHGSQCATQHARLDAVPRIVRRDGRTGVTLHDRSAQA